MLVFAVIAFACRPSSGDDGDPSRSEAGVEPSEEVTPSVPSAEPSDAESEGSEDGEDAEADGDGEDSGDGEGDEDEGGSGSGSDSEGGSGGGSGDVAAPERPEDPCRPQDVVVSFDFASADKETYGGGEEPGFRITVVNTAEQTCTVDVGPEALELRIHSGDDRIFSTADCVEGSSAEERQLRRGVPHEYTITWERMRSFTDCRDDSRAAAVGWYRANLHGDYAGDPDQLVFQLKA
ncbi:hypothetical protein [Nocardiopsis sp. NRRL B-16309]|uniref:hypothetical protein n=1 Tax=Nocardiopsis sp. NRRL B-16309 TaxID=1519494 RepID=UPI0018D184A4|nr:hypothetical protein [Nocardiopsis sp. NRRL B-16309]